MSTTASFLKSEWIKAQKRRGPQIKNAPTFYRNLEEALDLRRAEHTMLTCVPSAWKLGQAFDFSSNDTLSLSQTGEIRRAFLDELDRHADFMMHSGGSRVCDGNYPYIEQVEAEIATFHGAETALILGSGYEANVAILTAIPRPGDAIVYDELVHASTLDGMATSLAQCRMSFRHNDVDAFREAITSVLDSQPQIANGSRSILIAVESLYSMEGDICPLVDMLDVAKDMCPKGNAEFIIDEAHSTGNMGPKGAGLVSQLGLEKQIAVRLHTFGKSLASSGGEEKTFFSFFSVFLSFFFSVWPCSNYTNRKPYPPLSPLFSTPDSCHPRQHHRTPYFIEFRAWYRVQHRPLVSNSSGNESSV